MTDKNPQDDKSITAPSGENTEPQEYMSQKQENSDTYEKHVDSGDMTDKKPYRECDVAIETEEYKDWKKSANASRETVPLNIKTYEKVRMIEYSAYEHLQKVFASYQENVHFVAEKNLKLEQKIKWLNYNYAHAIANEKIAIERLEKANEKIAQLEAKLAESERLITLMKFTDKYGEKP